MGRELGACEQASWVGVGGQERHDGGKDRKRKGERMEEWEMPGDMR